ncbi:hypothetical protein Rahaq2_3489 [Rahnella aquatilis CIP 78.65 = ATCC 33071]|uniref:Uncharacterized protein n=1 Tax=Rahnella aquatilis (strain ATCC 33071 / DSM 4594 / JCM 1683 / NBRC 105701 / NCIMB 13365 / CIP 78.65) TaxID=745277 RepID=H2IZP5_RAHAC|nr:hypothetical protein Rahaq2_3489 [Rahnella aquatilis CIP 78.65 = ATCC 33071]
MSADIGLLNSSNATEANKNQTNQTFRLNICFLFIQLNAGTGQT